MGEEEAFMSVRIVVMDHYQGEPVEGLDPFCSDRGYNIRRVPVLRVFGSTRAGQKTTLHIHGIFPYFYVPWPQKENDGFAYRLANALDKALNVSLNQSKADIQHVYKAVKVSGRPFYGYHPRQHNFVKIYFYNHYMLKRASDLLAAGNVLGQSLQPHESHVPLELQFMMDYNLQGMNLIHLRHVVFRQGSLHDEYDDIEPFSDLVQSHRSLQRSSSSLDDSLGSPHVRFRDVSPEQRFFNPDTVPEVLKLPASVVRMSTCDLEVDTVAADILNTNDLAHGAMNPGLQALWEDEQERRRILNIPDSLSPPNSPPRPSSAHESSESEKFWLERFDKMLVQKKLREGEENEEPSSDPDATINIHRWLKPSPGTSEYAAETGERDLSTLPGATQLEAHVPTLSSHNLTQSFSGTPKRGRSSLDDSVLDLSASYMDDTMVGEGESDVSLDTSDEELVDVLADLAVDEEQPASVVSVAAAPKVTTAAAVESEANEITLLVEKQEAAVRHEEVLQGSGVGDEDDEQEVGSDEDIFASPPRRSKQSQSMISNQNSPSHTHPSLYSPQRTCPPSPPNRPPPSGTPPSQKIQDEVEDIFSQSLCLSESEDLLIEDFDDDLDTLEMSQTVWAEDPFDTSKSDATATDATDIASATATPDFSDTADATAMPDATDTAGSTDTAGATATPDATDALDSSLWDDDDDVLLESLGF